MNAQFRHLDTKKPDGFYIQFHILTPADDSGDTPEDHNEGFWPSRDKDDAGYIGAGRDFEARFSAAHDEAQARLERFNSGDWHYIGVQAEAHCLLVHNDVGTFYELRSAGIWGVESDAGPYLQELYEEQKAELLAQIALMRNPIIE